MISINTKAEIIEEFVRGNTHADGSYTYPEIEQFVRYNDIGVPLAQSLEYGLCILTDEGEKAVESTWINLCMLLNIDSDGEYTELADLFRG